MTQTTKGPGKSGPSKLVFSDLSSMIELSGANNKKSFASKNFENTIVEKQTISGISLDNCFARNIVFIDCVFLNCEFHKAWFTAESRFSKCLFDKCSFQEAEFDQCNFESVVFSECKHFESYFSECLLENVSFVRGSCDTFLFSKCNYRNLQVSDVEVIPRRNMKKGINGTAFYLDTIPDHETVKALSLLGVTVEKKLS